MPNSAAENSKSPSPEWKGHRVTLQESCHISRIKSGVICHRNSPGREVSDDKKLKAAEKRGRADANGTYP